MNQGEGQENSDRRLQSPEELRALALWRHHEFAYERAALLLALSRFRVTDREMVFQVHGRQRAQLIDLLHEFSYHARKTIELAEEHRAGTVERAQSIRLLSNEADLGIEGRAPLSDKSLWWLLGRVIHSREITIRERQDVVVGSEFAAAPRTTSYWTMLVVGVRSDYDGPDELHFMSVDGLIEAFCLMTPVLTEALDVARRY